MTDAAFRSRSLRTLAVAGVLGLVASPIAAPAAFAAPNKGDIKVSEPNGVGKDNEAHIEGCNFDVIAENFPAGTFVTSFTAQPPTGDAKLGISGDTDVVVTEGTVRNHYTLESVTGTPQPNQGWHVKVNVAAQDGKVVDFKVFWLECQPKPPTTPSATPSVPGKVNSGLEADTTGGAVALGLGGLAVVGLGALGLRRRSGR
ncbi:hypothetical protein [Raineyella fluvialis]|uniref:LPXTG-motif cell wall anchor domain-containing protein n=1 Tax=Raineyella fluvialis TaxID=2662261 RepID=A0A5Q2F742_9ACTN|nr:hypothetical protein [Raineyella fluvialis]QGF22810.1 hypothetical protein Rai3103_03000 [Raineyella fluvialis]